MPSIAAEAGQNKHKKASHLVFLAYVPTQKNRVSMQVWKTCGVFIHALFPHPMSPTHIHDAYCPPAHHVQTVAFKRERGMLKKKATPKRRPESITVYFCVLSLD